MFIISPETDYYDVYSKIYGVDKLAVFKRDITYYDKYSGALKFNKSSTGNDEIKTNIIKSIQYDETMDFRDHFPLFRYKVNTTGKFYFDTTPYLVVCGKVFKLVEISEYGTLRKSNETDGKIKRYDVYLPHVHRKFYHNNGYDKTNIVFNKETKFFVDLCKKVGLPVFIVYPNSDKAILDIFPAPLLCTVGLQNIWKPEKLYQDIEYYLLNVINESPDTMPKGNPGMTDKEKILAKGFDLKKIIQAQKECEGIVYKKLIIDVDASMIKKD